MFPAMLEKIQYLRRRPCQFCMPFERVDVICFQLKAAPVSRQVDTHQAFKQAVQDLARVRHDFSDFYDARLCVAATFVLGRRRRLPDLDNLAKTLLDALQGCAYRDDSQVEHLDLMRLGSFSDDSFIGVRVAATEIASHVDVINPEFDVAWIPTMGVGPIDLAPYLADAGSGS
jgi:Holliday junction resolvase RusA-like endonuclease